MSKSRASVAVQVRGRNGLFRAKQSVDIDAASFWRRRRGATGDVRSHTSKSVFFRRLRKVVEREARDEGGLCGDTSPESCEIVG